MSTEPPDPDESLGTVVNPSEDGVTLDLSYYDETLDGIDGVRMPDPPAERNG
jgi:hypothetical protein